MVSRFELYSDLVQRYSLWSLTRYWTDKVDLFTYKNKIKRQIPYKLLVCGNTLLFLSSVFVRFYYRRIVNVRITPLTPNDPYSGRTAPLTSKRCILYIYSTNVATEYFKHGIYSPFFFSSKCSLFHNSNVFGSCVIHILYTGVLKLKK